jgi:cytochrome bd-type quinol oxidase subunit 1
MKESDAAFLKFLSVCLIIISFIASYLLQKDLISKYDSIESFVVEVPKATRTNDLTDEQNKELSRELLRNLQLNTMARSVEDIHKSYTKQSISSLIVNHWSFQSLAALSLVFLAIANFIEWRIKSKKT